MNGAIGHTLPAAVGVAVSPPPIAAVVLTLVTPRGRGIASRARLVGDGVAG